MAQMTITEALAEIKTVGKRIEKKREAMGPYFARQDKVRDPLEKEGGSVAFVAKERQAIRDLLMRLVALRVAIQRANLTEAATVRGETRTVAEWLTWRRDVSKIEQMVVSDIRNAVNHFRSEAAKRNVQFRDATATGPVSAEDIVVTVSEKDVIEEAEKIEHMLGDLDGVLSLKNATTLIEV